MGSEQPASAGSSDRHAAGAAARRITGAQLLQVASSRDMAELRASEDAQLQSYGWVDRQAGIAAIPIKRAMALLAERGMSEKRAEKKADTKEQP